MTTPELNNRSRRWAEVLTPMLHALTIDSWVENKLSAYNKLPKANSQERKKVKYLVRQTADQILQNPHNIEAAANAWKSNENQAGLEFYDLVKKESEALIEEKWKDITPEQLSRFIKIYSDSDLAPDFAKSMLKSFFLGPKSRRHRIDAYYTFVSGILDITQDRTAFDTGVRIGFHDTDILPRDPHLIEQTIFMSLPYDEKEKVFLQKFLIARSIMLKLTAMGSEELRRLPQKEHDFLDASEKSRILWTKERERAKKVIGENGIEILNNKMIAFTDSIASPAEKKDEENWIRGIFGDENDPLNQKFKKTIEGLKEMR